MLRGNIALLDPMQSINTTILLINGRGNRKHLLIGDNLLSSCLAQFGRVTALLCHLLCAFPVSFNQLRNSARFSSTF